MDRIRQRLPLFVLIAAGAVTIIACAVFHITPSAILAWAKHLAPWVSAHPVLGAMGFVLIVTASVASALPGSIVLDVAGGAVFGLAAALPLALVGEVLGATILYLAGRRAFTPSATVAAPSHARISALADRMRDGYQRSPWGYTLLIRCIPMMPTGAVSLVLAWLGCPMRLFLVATTVGETIMLAAETGLGAGLETAFKHGFSVAALANPSVLVPLTGLVVLLTSPALLRRRRQETTPVPAPATEPPGG